MPPPKRWVIAASLAAGLPAAGCTSVPPLENPVLVRPDLADVENPLHVEPGTPTPEGYAFVYGRVIDAVDDYFEVLPGPRYEGAIRTAPRIAAGFEQPWRGGTPDKAERLRATLQTVRHYAIVRLSPGERGGYRVYVEVYRELEDLPQPASQARGPASFRETATVDRRIEAVSADARAGQQWIPDGRDCAFEQEILKKIQLGMCR